MAWASTSAGFKLTHYRPTGRCAWPVCCGAMEAMDEFTSRLAALGFAIQENRRGVNQYARQPNPYLTQWVHDDGDEALFTWEFALGEFFEAQGWQIGAAETSLHILYPQFDVRTERDADAIAVEIDRLESRLRTLDLVNPAV